MKENKPMCTVLSLYGDDRDTLSELLSRELDSWLEFYRYEPEEVKQIEDYTCFKLLKQMDYPLDEEIKIIENAKKKCIEPMPKGEDKLNWIDLTELAAKKYPHLGDDCE